MAVLESCSRCWPAGLLDAAQREAVGAASRTVHVRAGEPILVAGEPASFAAVLLRGAAAHTGDGLVRVCLGDARRARGVTRRARGVTRRARWVTLRARWVTPRARWVTFR
jgi:hypothetical protein